MAVHTKASTRCDGFMAVVDGISQVKKYLLQ